MKTYFGSVVRDQRKKMKLTQSQLAQMIYSSQATISKIEMNKLIPKIGLLEVLSEKLGLPKNKCYVLTDKLELKILRLENQIIQDIKGQNIDKVGLALDKLESCITETDVIEQQFIIWVYVVLGRHKIGKYKDASPLELIVILEQAITKTISNFDSQLTHCKFDVLSLQEIRILNTIANLYGKLDNQPKAIEIYSGILKYMTSENVYIEDYIEILPLIIANCGRAMGLEKRYKESVAVSEYGIKICKKYLCGNKFNIILNNMGCSLYYLGEKEQAKKYLMDAVNISRIFGLSFDEQESVKDLQLLYPDCQASNESDE